MCTTWKEDLRVRELGLVSSNILHMWAHHGSAKFVCPSDHITFPRVGRGWHRLTLVVHGHTFTCCTPAFSLQGKSKTTPRRKHSVSSHPVHKQPTDTKCRGLIHFICLAIDVRYLHCHCGCTAGRQESIALRALRRRQISAPRHGLRPGGAAANTRGGQHDIEPGTSEAPTRV